MSELDYRGYWRDGYTWDAYLGAEVRTNRELWEGVYRRARVPAELVEEARQVGSGWKLLVISEDWCGDASNTVPVMARLAEAVPDIDLRVVKRDETPELMDRWLTDGARSIPLVVVLDEGFEPVGRWGPRPEALQEWTLAEKRAGLRSKEEIYRDVRAWYARDRGASTVRGLLEVMRGAAVG